MTFCAFDKHWWRVLSCRTDVRELALCRSYLLQTMGILRQLKPSCTSDLLSLTYALILIHGTIIFGDFVVAPWMVEEYGTNLLDLFLYNLFGLFIYVNVIGNMLKIILTNTSTVGVILPTLLKPGKGTARLNKFQREPGYDLTRDIVPRVLV